MSYIMLKSDKDVKALTDVDQYPLDLKKALGCLLTGETLVISKYETTTGRDVFVRLDQTTDTPITEISYASPSSTSGAVWTGYPVAINTLSIYEVYEFDANLYGSMVFQVGDTVKYKTQSGAAVGLVNKVLQDSSHNLYYQINGELYTIAEAPDSVTVNSNISGMTIKQPVADTSEDYHTIDVSDYKDTVYVLY